MYIPSLSWFTVAQLQCVYLPFTLLVIPGAQILDFFYSLLFLVGMWIHVSEQENKTKQIGMGLVHCVARNQAFFLFFFKHVFKNPGCSSRIIKVEEEQTGKPRMAPSSPFPRPGLPDVFGGWSPASVPGHEEGQRGRRLCLWDDTRSIFLDN